MSFNIGDIFSKIPQEDFNVAINSGLLLAAAVSIFYVFFGRLFSLPELVGITLRNPTCSRYFIQLNYHENHLLSFLDSFLSLR